MTDKSSVRIDLGILFIMLPNPCTLKTAYVKIQNIKWFNQKIVTMPIETSEEVIFNR